MYITHDSGTISKQCECYTDGCASKIIGCDKYGCIDGKCNGAPHMICDLDGHGIQRSQLRSSMVVKIRTMHRHWPGYEYLYASKDGRYLVIIIKMLS